MRSVTRDETEYQNYANTKFIYRFERVNPKILKSL